MTTTPRMDTHYLVTEYGAVNLMGNPPATGPWRSSSWPIPRFRDSLMEEARKMCLA